MTDPFEEAWAFLKAPPLLPLIGAVGGAAIRGLGTGARVGGAAIRGLVTGARVGAAGTTLMNVGSGAKKIAGKLKNEDSQIQEAATDARENAGTTTGFNSA